MYKAKRTNIVMQTSCVYVFVMQNLGTHYNL